MKISSITLGCKVNQYETNAMEQKFMEKGYKKVENNSDICIVNTCSVTNIAEKKSRQMLRRAKELNPNAVLVACGCYAQVAEQEIQKIPEVDIILGNNEKEKIAEIVEEYISEHKKITDVKDVMHYSEYNEFGITTHTELNRAVIKIQDGCDRFCTYCIIPYARGAVRSREPESIIEEIKSVTKLGIKEVVLTGIHIASYGKDFNKTKVAELRKKYGYNEEYKAFDPKDDLATGGFRFIELIEQINKIEEIEAIRLGSIEPKLITEEFLSRLSKCEKVCHHFHLSLQSGCDETLARMNRRYTTEEFMKSVELLRKIYADVALTTDIIVGFPGETENEFNTTYKFLESVNFYKMHVFKYSPKRGTKALVMPNQVSSKIKEERSKRLIELSDRLQVEQNKKYLGQTMKVLFEEAENGYFKGHTGNYILVKVETKENLENQIKDVKLEKLDGLDIIGSIL